MTLRTATTWNVLIAWPVYLTCAVIPSVVLLLFAPGTPPAGRSSSSWRSACWSVPPPDRSTSRWMLGRSVQSLRNNMAALVTNLVLNVLLIPRLGISGRPGGRPRSWCRTRCPPGRSAPGGQRRQTARPGLRTSSHVASWAALACSPRGPWRAPPPGLLAASALGTAV
ncbi:MAG: hypothetical protein R2731_06295 [Nocardioides sp.]